MKNLKKKIGLFVLLMTTSFEATAVKNKRSLSVSREKKQPSNLDLVRKIQTIRTQGDKKHEIKKLLLQHQSLLDSPQSKSRIIVDKNWKNSQAVAPVDQDLVDQDNYSVFQVVKNHIAPEKSTRFFMIWNTGMYGMFRTPFLGGSKKIQERFLNKVERYLECFKKIKAEEKASSSFLIELFLDQQTYSHIRKDLAALMGTYSENFKVTMIEDFFNHMIDPRLAQKEVSSENLKKLEPGADPHSDQKVNSEKFLETSEIRGGVQPAFSSYYQSFDSSSIVFSETEKDVIKKIFSNASYGNPALVSDALRILALRNKQFEQNFYSDIDTFVENDRLENAVMVFRQRLRSSSKLIFAGDAAQMTNDILACFSMKNNAEIIRKMIENVRKQQSQDQELGQKDFILLNYYQDKITKIKYDYRLPADREYLEKTVKTLIAEAEKFHEQLERLNLPEDCPMRAMYALGPHLIWDLAFGVDNPLAEGTTLSFIAPSHRAWMPSEKWISYEKSMQYCIQKYLQSKQVITDIYNDWKENLIESNLLSVPINGMMDLYFLLKNQQKIALIASDIHTPQKQQQFFNLLKEHPDFREMQEDDLMNLINFQSNYKGFFENNEKTQEFIEHVEKFQKVKKIKELYHLLEEWSVFFLTKDSVFLDYFANEVVNSYKQSFFCYENNEDTKALYAITKTLQNQLLSVYYFAKLSPEMKKRWSAFYSQILQLENTSCSYNPEDDEREEELRKSIQDKYSAELQMLKMENAAGYAEHSEMLRWLEKTYEKTLALLKAK